MHACWFTFNTKALSKRSQLRTSEEWRDPKHVHHHFLLVDFETLVPARRLAIPRFWWMRPGTHARRPLHSSALNSLPKLCFLSQEALGCTTSLSESCQPTDHLEPSDSHKCTNLASCSAAVSASSIHHGQVSWCHALLRLHQSYTSKRQGCHGRMESAHPINRSLCMTSCCDTVGLSSSMFNDSAPVLASSPFWRMSLSST